MRRSGLTLILAVLALTLPGAARAAVTVSVFQDPSGTQGNTGTPGLPAVTIGAIAPATTPIQVFYQTGPGASTSGTVCLNSLGNEVCGWDIWVSTTSPDVVLQSFVPDTGVGSDIVWAITGNPPVFRANGGIPTAGEAVGIHRIGTLNVSKTNAASAGDVKVTGNLFVSAALAAVPVTTGNTLATATGGLDFDGDGFIDTVDNCPTVPNGLAQAAVTGVGNQIDGTVLWAGGPAGATTEASLPAVTGGGAPPFGDGVGDACDSCVNARNVRQAAPATFVGTNTWATLTGGQRDDDHDGFGNKCDGDFTPSGNTVGAGDTNEFIPSLNKLRTALTGCGLSGLERCARYDLDEAGGTNGSGDTNVYATVVPPVTPLLNRARGPKCPACPLPCVAGSGVPLGCNSVP